MASRRTRSSHQTKTDILIGAMSICLYILLGVTFFVCLSINNVFLRVVNRTLATTLLTFTAMTIAMHAVYGGFDVGRKKNKPVISALIGSTVITDLVTYLQLEIMNVNENYNERLMLFGPDLPCLLLCIVLCFFRPLSLPVIHRNILTIYHNISTIFFIINYIITKIIKT